jgi:putative mRNA 3-end processing factor
VTHGYIDIFTRYLNDEGWNAQVLQTQFGGEVEDETTAETDSEDVA